MTKCRDRERTRLARCEPRRTGRLRQQPQLGRTEHVSVMHEQTFARAQCGVDLTQTPDTTVDVEKERKVEQLAALERVATAGRELAARIPLQVPHGLSSVLLERQWIAVRFIGAPVHALDEPTNQHLQQLGSPGITEFVESIDLPFDRQRKIRV